MSGKRKELFERLAEKGIPSVRLSPEVWREHYANTYNILALDDHEDKLMIAAGDIIQVYLLLVAEGKTDRHGNPK